MGILKVSGKVLLIPLWFIVSIIGVGVKLLVYGIINNCYIKLKMLQLR